MAKLVTLIIDGVKVQVPEGTLVVDAAKKAGIDIPVFCYHPKMEPVGMCRMCLVEIGRPMVDRTSGQFVLDENGEPKIQFGAKLETACSTQVSEGMVVLGMTEKVKAGRKDILEFLLTSHPLDCPICDKGGECPLQNLTIAFGPGQSRYLYEEKMHLAKHVPLGELIFLDRERCIQCGRCVRFQSEIVADPVIGFSQRGRRLEIVTYSEPGFDSIFSGNTTDICPVGALTTADFRFRARPWELSASASICPHCAVGCNLTMNVRREAVSGGGFALKRVMPRQNEAVNEIWICDKGRFGYHFATKNHERLEQPLVRKNGELKSAEWDEAIQLIAERLADADGDLVTLVGGRLANEDLFNLRQLTRGLKGSIALYSHMGGGELTTRLGLAPGSNLAHLGEGAAVLVVASDLEQEGPLWWLRLKQAAERGAQLIVLNARSTKLDRFAKFSLRYPFGSAVAAVLAMVNSLSIKRPLLPEAVKELERNPDLRAAARAFMEAKDALILYGSDGLGLAESSALAQACANLLILTDHVGRANNGLLGVWPRANDQGAWELGFQPRLDLKAALEAARYLYFAAADPVGDDPEFQVAFGGSKFVVVQDLFLTPTGRLADVVLPVQSWIERQGSYTSAERRVQRFYNVYPSYDELVPTFRKPVDGIVHSSAPQAPLEYLKADFVIPALIAERLSLDQPLATSAEAVFADLVAQEPAFAGLSYSKLAEVSPQWPIVGRNDLYYGGTAYENTQGLGVKLQLVEDAGSVVQLRWPQAVEFRLPKLGMIGFPITRLYDGGRALRSLKVLQTRIGEPYVVLNLHDAGRLKVQSGAMIRMTLSESGEVQGHSVVVRAVLGEELPERVVLVPRSFGIPIVGPTPVEIKSVS